MVAHHRVAHRGRRGPGDAARRHLRRRHLRPRRPLARAAGAAGARGRLIAFDRTPRRWPPPRHHIGTGADPRFTIVPRQLRRDGERAGRARHHAGARRAARPGRQLAADRQPRARASASASTRRWTCAWTRPAARPPRTSWPAPTSADIAEVIRDHGEERFAFQIAKALVARREGGLPFEPPANFPRSWLVQSRPASRARTLQRARFRLFGFTSTPSLRRSNKG
jgi:hypothetical protein